MAPTLTHRLKNGVTVVLQHLPASRHVGLSALVRVGSGDEQPSEHGLSHLLEHMVFRGSEKYPSSNALLAAFEGGGGTLEAETWRDHTHFAAEVKGAEVGQAIAAMGDMLRAPRLLGLAQEKRLVAAEIAGELDEGGEEATLHTLTRQAIWPGHAMSRRITGTPAGVAQYTRAHLLAHHRRYYTGDRTVVSVAGPIGTLSLRRQLQAAFGGLPAASSLPLRLPPSFRQAGHLLLLGGGGPQLSMQLSFESYPLAHPGHPLQELVASILNDGMLSRLHQALSERTGLVYAFDAGLDVYSGCGTYDLELQVSPRRAAAALDVLAEVLAGIVQHGPTDQELARAKLRRRFARERRARAPAEAAYDNGLAALFPAGASGGAQAYDGTTAAGVRGAAASLFARGQCHLCIAGRLPPASRRNVEAAWQRLRRRLGAPELSAARRASRARSAAHCP